MPKVQDMIPVDPHRRPFSIRIFPAEGTPSGLKFVEKSNWTGVGVVCPRPRFTSVKDRKGFARAGVYVLVGPSDSSDRPLVYVGEGDPVQTRLEDHHSRKDFWTVIATTAPYVSAFVVALREDLLKSDVLIKRSDEFFELTQNYEFLSPSGAAAFLTRSSINGRDAWKTQNGQTLKHLQETASDS